MKCESFGDLEYIYCPYCGEDDAAILAKGHYPYALGDILALVKCSSCGFIYTNPRPSDGWYKNYLEHCMLNKLGVTGGSYERQMKEKGNFYKKILILLKMQRSQGKPKLLDIGCAGGAFLDMALEEGFEAMGCDCESTEVYNTLKNKKLNLLVGSLEKLGLKKESFGIITLLDTLEHVRDPLKMLKHIHGLLMPGGILLIVVPNFSLYYLQYKLGFKKINIQHFAVWTHVNFFTPYTMTKFLTKATFKEIKFYTLDLYKEANKNKILQGLANFVKKLIFYLTFSRINFHFPIIVICRK